MGIRLYNKVPSGIKSWKDLKCSK